MAVMAMTETRLLGEGQWSGRVYVGGDWVIAAGGVRPVRDKATGEEMGEVGWASAADVAKAAEAARAAQPQWAAMPPEQRREVFIRAAGIAEQHHEELAEWLMRETGGFRGKAEFELLKLRENLLQAATAATRPSGQLLPSPPGVVSIARRVPRGVVGAIVPWNFPLVLALRSIGAAMAFGNTIVLKADPHTPVSGGVVVARIFEAAGLPPGVLQVLTGDAEAGQAVASDPNIDMIAFTGSTNVGRLVQQAAAPLLKKVVTELGGNNPFVVLDDADLEAASSCGAWGSFLFQGQVCLSAGRHIVHRSIAEEYTKRLAERAQRLRVGDPWREDVELGPMISVKQLRRVEEIVDASVAAGATLVCGGKSEAPYYWPTVLSGVTRDMPAFTEEIFGPVAPITVVDSDDEAVEVANDTEYGLIGAVHGSETRAEAVADRIHAGSVHVNDQSIVYDVPAPIGGHGISGSGDAFGGPADDVFVQWQWITRRSVPAIHPF